MGRLFRGRRGLLQSKSSGRGEKTEVLLSQESTVGEVSRKLGITEQTYYRWGREYGGMRVDQARGLKELEKKNGRLKRLSILTRIFISINLP
jgi:putative transposase